MVRTWVGLWATHGSERLLVTWQPPSYVDGSFAHQGRTGEDGYLLYRPRTAPRTKRQSLATASWEVHPAECSVGGALPPRRMFLARPRMFYRT